MPATSSGAVTKGIWSTFAERTRARMRCAIKCWVAGLIIRSSCASRYQAGLVRHSGVGHFSWMQATAIGLCVAAKSLACCGEACCENAAAKASSGIQMKPGVGAELRCLRMRLLTIEDVGDRLSFIGREGRNVGQRADSLVGICPYYSAGVGMRG